jgi:hypothetical protein
MHQKLQKMLVSFVYYMTMAIISDDPVVEDKMVELGIEFCELMKDQEKADALRAASGKEPDAPVHGYDPSLEKKKEPEPEEPVDEPEPADDPPTPEEPHADPGPQVDDPEGPGEDDSQ